MSKLCKEFLLHKIAKLDNGNKFDKNKMTHDNPCYNFVSRTATNNGISDFVDDNGTEPYPAGTITLAFGGSIGSTFVQPKPYYTGQNVGVIELPDGVSEEAKVYFAVSLEKMCKCKYVAFADEINKHFKTDLTVILPVIENSNPDHEYTVDDIDWQYMRNRIAELERNCITELDAYLQATGLNDYELTDEDKKILYLSAKATSGEKRTVEDDSENEVRFGEFSLEKLFTSQTGDVDLQQKDVNGKGTFFINSGVENRGIKGKTDRKAKVFSANTITIDFWGNAYYRDFEYKMATHNHVFSLSGDVIKNKAVGLYIIGKLSKLPQLFSYNNMATWNKLKVLDISLPIKVDASDDYTVDDIDFDYMERYIRAMEKVVIADVIKYKDSIIEATKQIVNG